jgi:hypothetical protein
VAASTTSLPEALGGVRNWDYRYCWLRDAPFTLYSLMAAGYRGEALAWRDWLLRAVAGERFLGNFPQAFPHVSPVNTAFNLSEDTGPAEHRKSEGEPDAPAGVGGTSP